MQDAPESYETAICLTCGAFLYDAGAGICAPCFKELTPSADILSQAGITPYDFRPYMEAVRLNTRQSVKALLQTASGED